MKGGENLLRVVVKKTGNVRTAEDIESAIKLFVRKTKKEGIILECRKREFYVKPGVKRRMKHEAALKELRIIAKKRGY